MSKGTVVVIGVDEVGRGCWAGPLVAGAVVLTTEIEGLKDSKKLSAKQRSDLAAKVYESGAKVGLGWVWPDEIDQHGLTWAVTVAMQCAYAEVDISSDQVIIDGNINYLPEVPGSQCMVGADDKVSAVSAASIVAKVARDDYMTKVTAEYPGFSFDKHVGYGTKLHSQELEQYGPTPIHRKSYKPVKRFL